MKKYDSYKHSGVKWLGEIPDHWEVKRIKTFFKEVNQRSFDGSEDLLSVSQYTGVTKKSDKVEEGDLLTNASTLEGYKLVKKGDLVSNIMLAWNGSLGFSPYDGITSPAYSIYRLKTDDENRYFHYLLRTNLFKAEFKRQSSGVIESRLRLYSDDFFAIKAIIPPLSEQQAIADFLDDKTAKIDQAIAIKEKEITLLKERRQILIQELVTGKKVWDGTQWTKPTRTKDSGVDWIGEIPEEWEVINLRLLAKIFSGGTPDKNNSKYWEDGKIPWIASGEVNQEFVTKPTAYISELGFRNSSAKWIRKNSLVVALAGQGKTKGMVAYLKIDTTGNQSLAAVIPYEKYVLPLFLFYYIKSAYFELRGTAGEGERDGLNLQKLGNLKVTLSTKIIQEKISLQLIESNNKIQKAISIKQQEIEKLKEYKTVLIDNVVTGKAKVS